MAAPSTSTGSSLELFGHWAEPPWSQQPNGTVCAPMMLGQLLRLQALFAEVAALLATLGVRWLLSHGSLLGAWLHHGPVPWDEEGDLVLLPEDFARLHAVLGPPEGAELRRVETGTGRMVAYEGRRVTGLQYDYHEHTELKTDGWLATAYTFRIAGEPRDTSVHLDAFLARSNGSHAWTDSAVLPLEVLLPPRWLRFYDWLVPVPHDAKEALRLWYGPRFTARRKCPLRQPDDPDRPGAYAAAIQRIAEVSGRLLAQSYPMVSNELLAAAPGDDPGIERLRCTVHKNASVLWALELDHRAGRVLKASGLPRRPRLHRLGEGPADSAGGSGGGGAGEAQLTPGAFPSRVPNLWD